MLTIHVVQLYHVIRIFFCDLATQIGCGRLCLKCDGTHVETRFCHSAKRTSPFKSAGASVQSATGSRGVRISGSNAGYTKFRGSEGYWPPTPFVSFSFTSPPVRHLVPSRFNRTLPHIVVKEYVLRVTCTLWNICLESLTNLYSMLLAICRYRSHRQSVVYLHGKNWCMSSVRCS
jgi:hypothetical protein